MSAAIERLVMEADKSYSDILFPETKIGLQ